MRRRTNKIMLVINKNIMYYLSPFKDASPWDLSTEYWDKQQEELQEKWRKEREQKNKNKEK